MRKLGGRFSGGLVGTSAVAPGLAAVVVTILYVYRASPGVDSASISGTQAYVLGTAGALCFWVVLGFLFRSRLTSVKTANTAVYNELLEFYGRIGTRTEAAQSGGRADSDESSRAALAEAQAQLNVCRKALAVDGDDPNSTGMEWILASGYAAVWRHLHRAQEALLLLEPTCDIIGIGLLDEARLESSTVPGREALLRQLRTAIAVLDPAAKVYLIKGEDAVDETGDDAGAAPVAAECQARVVLRNTARIINEFRDDRREGLIRARNSLYRTVFVSGLAVYLLLGLALVREVDELSLVAMSAFYLVGAIMGLFRQLGQASSIDTVKEGDYGLSTARLFQTPLFSGLAAVGGVVVIAIVGAVIPAEGGPNIPSLREIFDLGKNQFGLVGAAVFGLTPNLLSQRLEKQAEEYKDDLKSTEASGATNKPVATG